MTPSGVTRLPVVTAMAAWTLFVVKLVFDAQRRRATTGRSGMLGQLGIAQTDFGAEAEGWVLVQGERWRAAADAPLASGEHVEVVHVEGLRLKVRKEE